MSDDGWLTDHALGEEGEDARARAQRRIAADPALRRRAEQFDDVVARLQALPPTAWTGLEEPAAEDRSPDPRAEPIAGASVARDRAASLTRRRGRLGVRRELAVAGMLVAVLAVGTALGAIAFSSHAGSGTGPVRRAIALRPLSGAGTARGTVRIASSGAVRLAVSGLAASGPGRFYEAWLMTSRTRLVAIASFRVGPGGRATVSTSLPAPASGYRYVDVSLQRAAAGPAHSGDSVLRGPTR